MLRSKISILVCNGPNGSLMVKNTYVDHFGPFRTPLDHFGVFASLPLVESTVEPSFHGARERDLIDQKNN